MNALPADFAELLTDRGRTFTGDLKRQQLVTADGLLSEAAVRSFPSWLEQHVGPSLSELVRPVPPATASSGTNGELLPKVGRVLSSDATEPLGLLRSEAFRAFVERLCGYAVMGPVATQVLCYRPGDYAGPHTDHRPEFPQAQTGYTDVHLTFCSGVERQLLVYEQAEGHLSGVVDLARSGLVSAYRLPLWHYTTPLEGPPHARRWLLLATFVDG